jgi:hypothetical protein
MSDVNPDIPVTGSTTFQIGYVTDQQVGDGAQIAEFSVQAAGALRTAPIANIFNTNGDAKVLGGYNETRLFYYWGYFALAAPVDPAPNSTLNWPDANAPGTDLDWAAPPSPPNTAPPITALTVVAGLFFSDPVLPGTTPPPVRAVADWVDYP